MPTAISERLCSVAALDAELDPISTGGVVGNLLAIEMPPPWGDRLYDNDPDGTILQRIWAARTAYFDRLHETGDFQTAFAARPRTVVGIAPDPEWSDPALRRVLMITRPEGAFSRFDITEYQFPFDSLRVVDLVRATMDAPAEIPALDEFRVEHEGHREFFVCTHGQVDICCARFGVKLYQQARRAFPRVRAWRTTHFGGHRYAPTAWEFPSGYKWAYLDEQAAEQVIDGSGHPAALAGNVRGWSGVRDKIQMLDRLGLERFGWAWLDSAREGAILEADLDARRWRVRLGYRTPSGECGSYEATVVVGREVRDKGCGREWGEHEYTSPEYVLEDLVHRQEEG